MFVSDELVFLQLQKTAGTHIAAVLSQHLDGGQRGKHGPLDFDPGDRLIVGSVRNPWDWYVSLWAYGCGTQGGVQGLLKNGKVDTAKRIAGAAWRSPSKWPRALADLGNNARRDVGFWRDVYSDPHDPLRFRKWLHAVLSTDGRKLLGADYAHRPLSGFAGFYTYRFLSVFTPATVWAAKANAMGAPTDIAPWFERNGAPSMFIRNEQLEEDLAEIFAVLGKPELSAEVLRGDRTNASKRGKAGMYYDAETLAMVGAADPFICATFAYSAPELEAA